MIGTKEQARVPLVCETCNGERGKEISWCPKGCRATPEGCTHEVVQWEDCPACHGSGVQACSICDKNAAMMVTAAGEPACDSCGLEQDGQLRLLDVA